MAKGAREAVRDGWRSLVDWPGLTSAAALISGVALAATWAALARTLALVRTAITRGDGSLAGRALLVALAGFGFAALLVEVGRACALVAYAGPHRTAAPSPLLRGLARTPAMITLRAVELTVYAVLFLGVAIALTRLVSLPTPSAALAGALLLAPPAALALGLFAATRIAITLTARGVPAAPALVRGLDLTLRRLPSLVRLGVALAVATLPFSLGAVVLTIAAGHVPSAAAHALAIARAVCLAIAALWSYAALSALAGGDPRLAIG